MLPAPVGGSADLDQEALQRLCRGPFQDAPSVLVLDQDARSASLRRRASAVQRDRTPCVRRRPLRCVQRGLCRSPGRLRRLLLHQVVDSEWFRPPSFSRHRSVFGRCLDLFHAFRAGFEMVRCGLSHAMLFAHASATTLAAVSVQLRPGSAVVSASCTSAFSSGRIGLFGFSRLLRRQSILFCGSTNPNRRHLCSCAQASSRSYCTLPPVIAQASRRPWFRLVCDDFSHRVWIGIARSRGCA